MAKNPSAMKAGATKAPPPRSNPERLRLHLRSEGLAAALLDAWTSGAQADSAERLRKAADDFFEKAKRCDDSLRLRKIDVLTRRAAIIAI